MKTFIAALLLTLTLSANAADQSKKFLANNGKAIITISEIGEVTVEGEVTPEVLTLISMIRMAIKHTCRVSST